MGGSLDFGEAGWTWMGSNSNGWQGLIDPGQVPVSVWSNPRTVQGGWYQLFLVLVPQSETLVNPKHDGSLAIWRGRHSFRLHRCLSEHEFRTCRKLHLRPSSSTWNLMENGGSTRHTPLVWRCVFAGYGKRTADGRRVCYAVLYTVHGTQKHPPKSTKRTRTDLKKSFQHFLSILIALKLTNPYLKYTLTNKLYTFASQWSHIAFCTGHGSSDFCPLLALWRAPSSSLGRLGNVAWLAKMGRWKYVMIWYLYMWLF